MEGVKNKDLVKELAKVKENLQKESDEHGILHATVRVVCDELEVVQAQESSSFTIHVTRITDQVGALVREAVLFGVHQAFAVTRSHYENINLEAMGEGFAAGYTDPQFDAIEKTAKSPARSLADKMEGEAIP